MSKMEVSTFELLDELLICDSRNSMWARYPMEALTSEVEEFGRRVECLGLDGAYFYEFDRVDNSRT